MKQIPQIQKFMTEMPHTINPNLPLKTAIAMMRQYGVRHLPVQEGGRLVGVVTDRDVKLAASFSGAQDLTVNDVMTPDPYTVAPEVPLDAVVMEMAERKYGCAVIQDHGKVVGIFTAIDGMRTLAEILQTRFKPSPGGPEARR